MKIIENKSFDEERALYGSEGVRIVNCRFEGEADGESAFKESRNIEASECFFDLRYPFWHDDELNISSSEFSESCRAALWYSKNIKIESSKLFGIKALRNCETVEISDCDIKSAEFGWFSEKIGIKSATAEGEYFMLHASELQISDFKLLGKYSFQYIENAVFQNCVLNTKDAFWHAKNVTVKNCEVNGEYLAWYAENITFENCKISGTQPFCYCRGLRLINCTMTNADLAFEKSSVEATLTAPVISIKNPRSGSITLPYAEEIIMDSIDANCKIFETERENH